MLIQYIDFLARATSPLSPYDCCMVGIVSVSVMKKKYDYSFTLIATQSVIASSYPVGQYPHTICSKSSLFCCQYHIMYVSNICSPMSIPTAFLMSSTGLYSMCMLHWLMCSIMHCSQCDRVLMSLLTIATNGLRSEITFTSLMKM